MGGLHVVWGDTWRALGCADFPVVFDINLNVSRAAELLTYLRDGSYLDGHTHMVQFEMLLFNPEVTVM